MRTALVVLFAGCILLAGCRQGQQQQNSKNVFVTSPTPAGISTRNVYSGIIQEAHEIDLGFKTPGQLVQVAVKDGQYVHQGQLIAVLDDADYRLGVEAAQVQYDQMKSEVARLEKLHTAKSISDNDYEKAVSGLRQLEVQLQANRNKLAYTRLYAPVNGYVKSINFSRGEMVDTGTPVITLLDINTLEVEVNIPLALYRLRDKICRISSGAEKEYEMRLRNIVPQSDGSQLYKMRLAFLSPDVKDEVSAGMNISVEIELNGIGETSSGMTVPARAVFQDEGKSYVWVIAPDNAVHRKEVQISQLDDAGNIVVISGLDGSEQVVRAGVSSLHEGEKVTVATEHSETNVGNLL